MTRQSSVDHRVNVEAWNIDAFSDRFKEAMGGRTPYSIQKQTGIAQSLIGKYLAGSSTPGTDKLVLLANVLGVSIEWLATGKGAPEGVAEAPKAPPAGPSEENLALLEEVATAAFVELQARNIHLEPAAQARLVRVLYRHFASKNERPDHDTVSNIIDLAAYR